MRREVAEELGLKTSTIVAVRAGDQGVAGIGAGAVSEGIVSVNIGTSGVVFTSSNYYRFDPLGRLRAFCHAVPSKWHLMGYACSEWKPTIVQRHFMPIRKRKAKLIGEDPYNLIIKRAEIHGIYVSLYETLKRSSKGSAKYYRHRGLIKKGKLYSTSSSITFNPSSGASSLSSSLQSP